MEQYLTHFGQRLRTLRTREGMTQAELAARLGVGQGHIATLEAAAVGQFLKLQHNISYRCGLRL